MIVRGMFGLGDNIYQRAFIRNMPGVYLETPWPELYRDLEVKCLRPSTRLRTQAKNVVRSTERWHPVPDGDQILRISYGHSELQRGSIVSAMSSQLGVSPVFDLPDFGSPPIPMSRPVAVVRPVTVRKEWMNSARGPKPDYINRAAIELRRRGYLVVSIADLEPEKEWLIGDPPPAHVRLHRGELSVAQMLALVSHASVVVGGVGWIVPACIAAKTPLYVVLGGNGAHNAPEKVTDKASMDLSRTGWAMPEKFCRCSDNSHQCDKEIRGFDEKFSAWLDGQGLFGKRKQRPRVAA